jgi:hypothetical protein
MNEKLILLIKLAASLAILIPTLIYFYKSKMTLATESQKNDDTLCFELKLTTGDRIIFSILSFVSFGFGIAMAIAMAIAMEPVEAKFIMGILGLGIGFFTLKNATSRKRVLFNEKSIQLIGFTLDSKTYDASEFRCFYFLNQRGEAKKDGGTFFVLVNEDHTKQLIIPMFSTSKIKEILNWADSRFSYLEEYKKLA